jgi:hypothetical protein
MVEGHGFSRAEKPPLQNGFSPRSRSLKPFVFDPRNAGLKPGASTQLSFCLLRFAGTLAHI